MRVTHARDIDAVSVLDPGTEIPLQAEGESNREFEATSAVEFESDTEVWIEIVVQMENCSQSSPSPHIASGIIPSNWLF